MEYSHRREFLKKSIMGISGAALLPAMQKSVASENNKISVPKELPARILGKTGIKIPMLSMGTGDTNNPALVKAVLDKGILLFGTSAYYGNGNNESMLGGVLRSLPRDSYMVATSTMPRGTDHEQGLFTDPGAASAYQKDIESSMNRLGVDYLDILFLPFAAKRESVFFEPLLRVMEDFKKKGKARYIGIATHSYADEAIRAAADTGIYDVAMAAYNFRLEHMQAVNEAVAYGASAGLGIIAMKTMAGGFWDEKHTRPINSVAALKWVLQNENIHTIMSGITTFEELQSNLDMMRELKLSEDELNDLRLTQLDKAGGLYCLQCRNCSGQCLHNLNIPTLMRSYMYAYGYRNFEHALQTLYQADLSGNPCEKCEVCRVNCAAGFHVKDRILNIARLKDVPREFLMA